MIMRQLTHQYNGFYVRYLYILAVVFLLLSSTIISGCRQVRGAQRVAADVLIPPQEETALGEQLSASIEGEMTVHSDEVLQNYITELGIYVVRAANDRPRDITFKFKVIDDPETINAFALPGGWIYVYTGLIKAMDNEAELVGVLSHEVAHVTRRHIAQRLVAMFGLEVLSQVALGQEPGIISQLVATIAQQGFLLSYSRDQERDADRYGLGYMVEANYNPQGLVSFFRKLNTDRPSMPTLLSSHPLPRERMENMRALIDQLESPPTRTEQERFQSMKARIN